MLVIKGIDDIRDNIDLTYNIPFEMISCLSLLNDPEGYNHNKWAKEVRKKLPEDILEQLDFWGEFEHWYFALDLITVNGLLSFRTPRLFFQGIQELSTESILDVFWTKQEAWKYEDEEKYRSFSVRNESYKKLVEEPEKHAEKLKNFLQQFYFSFFETLAPKIEFSLMQAVNERLNTFAKAGIGKLCNSFGRKVSYNNGDLLIKGWQNREHIAGKDVKRIVFMPTIFNAPHLLIDDTLYAETVYIAFPVFKSPFLDVSSVSDDDIAYFAGIFRALGDPNRLKILLILEQREACNQDLVQELQISQAAVSKQLKRLRLYHFIEGEENEKNQVMYRLSNNRLVSFLKYIGVLERQNSLGIQEPAIIDGEHGGGK